jgi:Cu+-exporting ATPase
LEATDFEAVTGKGVHRQGRWPRGGARQRALMTIAGHRLRQRRGDRRPPARRGQDGDVRRVDGALAGIVAVADPIKATAAEAIRALHAIWAAGDHGDRRQRTHGAGGGRKLGIDEVRAGMLPEARRT